MNRFFIYEEYGAKYEMMIRDVATAHRIMPQWEAYQKGLEALAASLGSVHKHLDHSKKSLTLGDLLVKVRDLFLLDPLTALCGRICSPGEARATNL
jgi:hypothetical protein